MRPLRAAALGLAGLVLAASPRARAADGDVLLEASLESASVRLGEDAVLRLRLTNRSPLEVEVPLPRLANDSVRVAVAWGGEPRAVVTRLYGEFQEEGAALRFREHPTGRAVIAPGGSLERRIAFPAVVAGELVLSATAGGPADSRLAAAPLTLEVQPLTGIPKVLVAEVETSAGAFAVELDGARAFNSVAHFCLLARTGFYDGLLLHRVVPDLLVQGGDPRGNGSGGPGWHLPAEAGADAEPLERGDVGLGRGLHRDSAGSQWFAVAAEGGGAERLERAFTRLGRVVEGQEVVDRLARAELVPGSLRPRSPAAIRRLRVVAR